MARGVTVSDVSVVPRTLNCIVCDSTEHQEDPRTITVFEFPGYGIECFTFPPNRRSVWAEEAERLVQKGGIPRYLCGKCHHGQ